MAATRAKRTTPYTKVRGEAMKLPLKQRADLAKRLLDSLDKVDQNEHWEIWADEAERRYRAHRAGKMSARPVEDLMRELRAELRRHAS